jgi:hypothetical protein
MRIPPVVIGCGLALVLAATALTGAGQLPVSTLGASGQTVTPVFEGWYPNPDGTFSLSFGYYNRNAEETVEIPVGASNFLAPGARNQGQPSHFQPRRHWGVFAVTVPANFGGTNEVTWTLTVRGQTFAIPGRLDPRWQIDALEGEAGAGNTPPVVKLGASGREARGPGGATAGPLKAVVGQPLALTLVARDDGRGGRGAQAQSVTLAWFKHQGPGPVTFAPPTGRVGAPGGEMQGAATFSEPGEYVLRARANDSSGVANAGHAQCCWTNLFVKVTVTRQEDRP